MLYLVATPIGNLADFSPRAIQTLQFVDLILCEDTRHTKRLTDHFSIATPLKSYHKFNEAKIEKTVLSSLLKGENIALVSDAGTPGIQDPGQRLVSACHKENIPVTAIPGPIAALQALVLSGLSTTPFQFLGFVPKKEGEKQRFISSFLLYPGSTIVYESPNRVLDTLEKISNITPDRLVFLARELTKKYEECLLLPAKELLENVKNRDTIKGEIALVIKGSPPENLWNHLAPLELLKEMQQTFNLKEKDAIKLAAELIGCKKREIYNEKIGKTTENKHFP